MVSIGLAFLIGSSLIHGLRSLPAYWLMMTLLSFCLLLCPLLASRTHKLNACLLRFSVLILSFSWASLYLHQLLAWKLPQELEKKTLLLRGMVIDIPQDTLEYVRFQFQLDSLNFTTLKKSSTIVLNWYGPHPKLMAGQSWQLQASLKRPHGLANPGGLNYQINFLLNRLQAQGYVKPSIYNKLLTDDFCSAPLARIRQILLLKIEAALEHSPYLGFIQALTLGVKQHITQEQWQILRATGTNHLMAISGLHIGLVAGLCFSFAGFLWRRSEALTLKLPVKQAAAIMSFIGGLCYSLLAGFSIPTQRALIMLATMLTILFAKRKINVWQPLSLALILVIIINPLATFSMGFWLSFAAVAAILYGSAGRFNPKGVWWKYGQVQWAVTLGLLPLSLLLFGQVSLSALLANLIAIPWVSFTVVPIALLGVVIISPFPSLGGLLLKIAALDLQLIMFLLSHLASVKLFMWQQPLNNPWIFFCAIVGVLLWLAPSGFPAKWLCIVWLLPLFCFKTPRPEKGELWLATLDVGQGLAVVIHTHSHVLIYDTGPKYGSATDAGAMVIVPYLLNQAISHVDTLIVSHGDNDHSGGVNSLLQQFKVKNFYTSVPQKFNSYSAMSCLAGQQWLWDGILFEILAPFEDSRFSGNNRSCVLRISIGKKHILLTGDIEKKAERELVQSSKEKLVADILLAPHHGSATSSTPVFIDAVRPKYVIFSTGYLNRFGFPKPVVVNRYQQAGVRLINTAQCGRNLIRMSRDDEAITSQCYREEQNILYLLDNSN